MDMGWSAEARKELDRLVRDFPQADLKERADNARMFIMQGEASQRRGEVAQLRKLSSLSGRPSCSRPSARKACRPSFNSKREIERQDAQQHTADLGLAEEIRKLSSGLPAASRKFWKDPVAEVTRRWRRARRRSRPVCRVAQGQIRAGNTGPGVLCPGDVELSGRPRKWHA